jgi:chromosome segregation ATPase
MTNAAAPSSVEKLKASNAKLKENLRRTGAEINELDKKLDEATEELENAKRKIAALEIQRDDLCGDVKEIRALTKRFRVIDASTELANEKMLTRMLKGFIRDDETKGKSRDAAHQATIDEREATIRGHEATIHELTATNHELTATILRHAATIHELTRREQDRLELEALAARGERDAQAEALRRSVRNEADDVNEFAPGVEAREDSEKVDEYL